MKLITFLVTQNSFLIAVALCLVTSISSAASFKLLWDDNPGDVSGYRIYVREERSVEFINIWEGSQNSYVVDDEDLGNDGVYVFVVRAFNMYGESENSNEVDYVKLSPDDGGCFISSLIE